MTTTPATTSSSCSSSAPSFPTIGVRLWYFNVLINSLGGAAALANLSTLDICKIYIKPKTASLSCSYCEYLQQDQPDAVGVAQVFISHAWQYNFLDVVDALQYHFQSSPEIILWFDLLSNNQHKAVSFDFHWWTYIFRSAIQSFGHTVMVLAP